MRIQIALKKTYCNTVNPHLVFLDLRFSSMQYSISVIRIELMQY
jgi:hypothetical protein